MKTLIIISGIAGAGKTTATNILEDFGYCCIDQYPVELLPQLLQLLMNDQSSKYENVALTIPISDLANYHSMLQNTELNPLYIIYDADKEVIINRYKFTRRIHPLLISNVADTLSEAIDIEKQLVNKFVNKNVYYIDTTSLTVRQNSDKLKRIIGGAERTNLSLSFVSFGFKYGIPTDADEVFDVRFLDNPYYDPRLRTLTGNDKEVQDYVLKSEKSKAFLAVLTSYLDFMINAYDKEEKRHLTICIGCTGGQHRSVTIANYLYEYYQQKHDCYLKHRELEG